MAGDLFYKDNEYGENVKALNITEKKVAVGYLFLRILLRGELDNTNIGACQNAGMVVSIC